MLFFQPLNDIRENVCGITIRTNHSNTYLIREKKKKKTDIHRHLDSSENNLKGSTQKYHWRRLSFQNSREISITQGTEILLCKIICGDKFVYK